MHHSNILQTETNKTLTDRQGTSHQQRIKLEINYLGYKMHRFGIHNFAKYHDLETWVIEYSTSLEMTQFDRSYMTFY